MTERKDGVRKVIQCPCGFVVEADGDDALVARAQDHARKEHGMELTSDQALAMPGPPDPPREGGRDGEAAALRGPGEGLFVRSARDGGGDPPEGRSPRAGRPTGWKSRPSW